ncbi:integrin alpha-4-like isoform X1 [Centruroides sculpturatus]|uniref:integrin alpha-4-like isoform X1 n=1 Tax=Centruroides sculpturatus TaxID=218467 RepID=UPI000C6E65BF|nr:integrin alpha-4-like isoform X1 [Centruroides sculpturatus]
MDLLTKLIPLAAIVLHNCQCFNVDTKFPIVFKGAKNSYFGFSVQLHQTDRKAWALIAAPKANSSSSAQHLHQPGVLNKCEISNQVCYEIILDYSYNQRKILGNLSYKEVKSDMMLGISLDVQPEDGSIVTCGHLWKNLEYSPFYSANGVCYVIDKYLNENNDLSNVEKLLPIIAKEKQVLHSPNVNFYAYGLAGFSAMFTENGKDLILGAPGIYEGKGSLIQYAVKNGAKLSPFPIIPDPNNTKERVHNDSYVGYSLTSGRFFNTTEIYIASGAPRAENDYGCVSNI